MQPKYRHTQKGGFLFYVIIALFGTLLTLHFSGVIGGHDPIPNPVIFCVAIPLMLLSALMMSALTVTIDDETIRIVFGRGLAFRKRYALDQIADCRAVRNSWFWGWGIRRYHKGWLYNIDGLGAVEVHFKNGKQARIGTDEPEKLEAAIKAVIG